MKYVVAVMLTVLCVFQASVMGSMVNVAPSATYSYPTDWPGAPGRWTDPGTYLNDNNLTNLVIESDGEPVVVIFDLGADITIGQLTVFATQTEWGNNGLSDCRFFANTEAQGGFTTLSGMVAANWNATISPVDKTNDIWKVDTGVLATPITARYIGVIARYATGFPAISEVAIYSVPEPATIGLLLPGLLGIFRKRIVR